MKNNITKSSHLRLLPTPLDTVNLSENVWSSSGTTSQSSTHLHGPLIARENRVRQLSALLKYLEKEVEILSYKLAEVCATLNIDIEDQLAEPLPSTDTTTITDLH